MERSPSFRKGKMPMPESLGLFTPVRLGSLELPNRIIGNLRETLSLDLQGGMLERQLIK